MRWNKKEILLAEEWEKRLFNENSLVVFTHKPNCVSEPLVMFEIKNRRRRRRRGGGGGRRTRGRRRRVRRLYTGTRLLYFLKLFVLLPHFSNTFTVV